MAKKDDERDEIDDDDDDTGSGGGDGSISAAEAARMRAALKKANREAQTARTELKEIKDAELSDSQKATQRADAAEQRADKAEQQAMRLQVALDKGLTASQAKRLVGDTVEELEADADELLESFGGGPSKKGDTGDGAGDDDDEGGDEGGQTGGKKPPSGRPNANLKSGAGDDDDEPDIDTDEVLKKIPRL